MNHTNSLSIPSIQLSTLTQDPTSFSKECSECEFDNRHDFIIDKSLRAIAAMFTVSNCSYPYRGIRRSVNVSIIDLTDDTTVSSATLRINLKKDMISDGIRLDIPLTYSDANPGALYNMVVTDSKSGHVYAEQTFRLYDEKNLGAEADEWYHVGSAGVIAEGEHELRRSVAQRGYRLQKLVFNLFSYFKTLPEVMPEVEVRIYFPDGSIENRFIIPSCDDAELGRYMVMMPFQSNPTNRGICYAEIISMDFAIAGFVFSTKGPTVDGRWTGRELDAMPEYSLEAATDRLREALCRIPTEEFLDNDNIVSEQDENGIDDEDSDTSTSVSDNEFDDMLSHFIKMQLDDTEQSDTSAPCVEEETDHSIVTSLSSLTGLKSVKEKLSTYEKVVMFNKMRTDHGLPSVPSPLHAMFLGSPGTGKTTVAKKMGLMLKRAGLLTKGHVVVRERSTLLGRYYSDEATKTLEALEEAQGGILLIDEAYQLYQPDDPRDPGRFVIETLMTALADERKRDWMLILCGYREPMMRMFKMNPGLKSRIPDSNIYTFEDFSDNELLEIAEGYFDRNGYSLTPEARIALGKRLRDDFASKTTSFGNARHVINLIQTDIIPTMAVRVITSGISDEKMLSEIHASDIPVSVASIGNLRRHIGFR